MTPVPSGPKVEFKHGLVQAFETVVYWSGATNLYLRARREHGAMILMYHSVSRGPERRFFDPASTLAAEAFEAQMRFIAKYRRVVSVSEIVRTLEEGGSLPAGTVAITFDDGYRDVLEVAAPVLERYELPATLYLATGYIESGENQWVDQLYVAISSRTKNELFLEGPVAGEFRLEHPEQVDAAYDAIRLSMIPMSHKERQTLLDSIRRQLKPWQTAPRLTLNWRDVARLIHRYPRIEIGAHSRDHVDLATCSDDTLRRELTSCVEDIELQLGIRPTHFSYPYGSFSAKAAEQLHGFGFRSAALTAPAYPVIRGTNRYALPRLAPPNNMSLFRFYTSGICPLTHELIEKINELKLGVQRVP
jgi:peptidoglycan/xylan/chitin deacetylase (PgdA/CDA1 family)